LAERIAQYIHGSLITKQNIS